MKNHGDRRFDLAGAHFLIIIHGTLLG